MTKFKWENLTPEDEVFLVNHLLTRAYHLSAFADKNPPDIEFQMNNDSLEIYKRLQKIKA